MEEVINEGLTTDKIMLQWYWINLRYLLAISSIHEFPSISIDFVPAFSQADLDVDVFMNIPLRIGVEGNRGGWLLKLNKSLYGINQSSSNLFDLLKLVYK